MSNHFVLRSATITLLLMAGCSTASSPPSAERRASYQHHIDSGIAAAREDGHQAAIESFTAAIDLIETPYALSQRGRTYLRLGIFDKSRIDHDRAIELGPSESDAYAYRAELLAAMAVVPQALRDLDQALALDARNTNALAIRGTLRMELALFTEARDDLTRVVELKPHDPKALNELAWLLATCPDDSIRDGARAKDLAQRACLGSHDAWLHLDTLAAAHALLCEFDQAVSTQTRAIDSAPEVQHEAMRQRLELYESEKPYFLSPG